MSLPDVPNTKREGYYSVMAGQRSTETLPENPLSTEDRYLDYIARNGGGGGGGGVTGVKGDAEEEYRTGNVDITAANVGAYTTTQTNTLLNGKTDIVEEATENNFAAFDESGNIKDSGKKAADFATPTDLANKVDKVTGKQLSTEDYTTPEKTKLSTVQTNATANDVIDTTVTLTVNGWVGNDAPYTQTVNVANVLSTDQAIVDLSVSSTVATGLDEIDDWALISKIETGTGTMTFTCYEDKPTTELTANVHIVRGTSSGAVSPTLKSVTWTGTGTNTRSITFPEKPTLILSIQFTNKDNTNAGTLPCRYGNPSIFCVWGSSPSSWNGGFASALTYSVDELTMTITGADKGSAWNDETTDYILYYM